MRRGLFAMQFDTKKQRIKPHFKSLSRRHWERTWFWETGLQGTVRRVLRPRAGENTSSISRFKGKTGFALSQRPWVKTQGLLARLALCRGAMEKSPWGS